MLQIFRYGFVILVLLFAAGARAEVQLVPESDLHAAEKHQQAIDIITHILTAYHYRKTELDDAMSKKIFTNYFDSLDPNRSFFTLEDVNQFSEYRTELDDALRNENLAVFYDIFKMYRQRVKQRIDYALSQLDREFNFEEKERYRYDRTDMPWPSSEAEIHEIWDKRIKNDYLLLKLSDKPEDEIRKTLHDRYERMVTSTFQLNANDVFQTFVNAYTTAVEPHTAYFSPRTSENFDISMSLSLEGIGAVLSAETDYTEVERIVTGGPADLSNELEAGDRIIGVAQGKDGEMLDVIGWRLDDVVDLIRGPKDSVVRLEILPKDMAPGSHTKTIELVRNKIKLEQQAAQSHIIDLEGSTSKIGVIDVPTFYMDFAAYARGDENYRSTTRDVRELIAELQEQGIDGLVIDLRGNGGGSLTEALELTGLFISGGPIVQTRDASGYIEIDIDPDPGIFYKGPLAVLVDRNSASASEIFAGAIQDYRRGIIIGEPTFGKGTVQNIIDLNRFDDSIDAELGRLKTTIAQFFRVSGSSNQHRGVIPDIIYPTAHVTDEYGERAYDNALPWDSIRPAHFEPAVAPVERFDLVREQHKKRIANNESFKALLKRTEFVQQLREGNTVSLNLEIRREERDRLQAEQEELDEEYRASLGLDIESEDDAEEDNEEADKPDILLREAARILNDLIVPWEQSPKQLHAERKSAAMTQEHPLNSEAD